MKNRLRIFPIALSGLLFGILACILPGWIQSGQQLELPTPAPSLAPPREVMPTLAASSAQTFEGGGTRISYGPDNTSCPIPQPLTLRINSDGTAELTTTGVSITDHINCTSGNSEETWYINGSVGTDGQSVNFISCNSGNFSAMGSVNFSGGNLMGEVSCFNKDGVKFISMQIGN